MTNLTALQSVFLTFIQSKKTFNYSVMKERIKWVYKNHAHLVEDRELEIGVYKDFLSLFLSVMNTDSVYYLSASQVAEIYVQVCTLAQKKSTEFVLSPVKAKRVYKVVTLPSFSCSHCGLDNDRQDKRVLKGRKSTVVKVKCSRCDKGVNLTPLAV